MGPYRDETMEKWLNKVNAANGIATQKKFKVINQSISSQIETALQSDKMFKRTKICRSVPQSDVIIRLDHRRSRMNNNTMTKYLMTGTFISNS